MTLLELFLSVSRSWWFGVETCVSSFGFWVTVFFVVLSGNIRRGRSIREGDRQAWCSEFPQQRWQECSQGNEGGAESNVRKKPRKGTVGMENAEVPSAREIDCVNIQERPAELAWAEKGKFTFWAQIPFFFLNPSVAHQGAPFQPPWKKGHPAVVGLLFVFLKHIYVRAHFLRGWQTECQATGTLFNMHNCQNQREYTSCKKKNTTLFVLKYT